MPGAYAHITLVNLAKNVDRLEAASVPDEAIQAVFKHLGFCELGAVSPDYPYLHLGSKASKKWADLMHYVRTGEPIRRGIEYSRQLPEAERPRLVAWLLGYAAHVVADLTIHPVVEMRVGEYAANAEQHRICEMNQDAYIYQRLNLDQIGLAEHLDQGIWACCESHNNGRLNKAVVEMWQHILSGSYLREYEVNEPEIDEWHSGFKTVVDIAEEGYRMPSFARHVAADCGLTYPDVANLDMSFIRNLQTPSGRMDYDAVFDKALNNIVAMWEIIGKAVYQGDQRYKERIRDWNLDTGKDKDGVYAYWPSLVAIA